MGNAQEGPERLVIKKYPNRRYYDATRSRHVTFEEIYGLIREGHDVQITDSKTGEDITAKVLAQLIIEMDPLKLGVFPVPLLHGLLRATPAAMTDYARRYWAQMFGSFAESQRDVGQYVQRMMGPPGAAGAGGGIPPAVADWVRMMWGGGGQAVSPAAAGGEAAAAEVGGAAAPADAGGVREELESLRRQMESLRRRVGGDEAAGGRPAAAPRKKRGSRRKR